MAAAAAGMTHAAFGESSPLRGCPPGWSGGSSFASLVVRNNFVSNTLQGGKHECRGIVQSVLPMTAPTMHFKEKHISHLQELLQVRSCTRRAPGLHAAVMAAPSAVDPVVALRARRGRLPGVGDWGLQAGGLGA